MRPSPTTVPGDLECAVVLTGREQGERFPVETDPPSIDHKELSKKVGNAGQSCMPILQAWRRYTPCHRELS
jgi:hypothetical protein